MRQTIQIIVVVALATLLMQSCADKKPEIVKMNVQYVSGVDEVTYLKIGKEITDTIGKTLKTNLGKAMKSGGPVSAVEFCNTKAMELTDIYSLKYNTVVKRVSDKNRNPKNAANKTELDVLADFKNMLENGQPLTPKVAIDLDGRKNYYAPIFTGGVCLTCHGNPKNMQPELLSEMDSLYPSDLARGYAVDELRGIWSIKFKDS